MAMRDPAHPGEVIREACLLPLKLSVTEAAEGLGISRQSLSELLNGRNGISAEMALRLEKAGWSTADAWLRMQAHHDLWRARQSAGKRRAKQAVLGNRHFHKPGVRCCNQTN